jgi:hypothetical protein
MDTMSAWPLARMSSATSGVLMRLLVTSGVVMPAAANSAFILAVTQANAARGTLVAIVGTRASCQPMPVLMRVAHALRHGFAQLHHLVPGRAIGHQVDHRQAVNECEVFAHRLTGALNNLDGQRIRWL